MSHFSPLAGLEITLPCPPPDNHCHRSGLYGRYPTAAYKDWLDIAAPQLAAVLGDWPPDTERWWAVTLTVQMGSRGDASNLIKPCLDLLSGACVDREGQLNPATGKREGAGKIRKPGGLWDDDRRVQRVTCQVACYRHPEPAVTLQAFPVAPPVDWRASEKQAARVRREQEREAQRQAREAQKPPRKAATR